MNVRERRRALIRRRSRRWKKDIVVVVAGFLLMVVAGLLGADTSGRVPLIGGGGCVWSSCRWE